MWLFTFTAARTALTYITVGALTVIWAGPLCPSEVAVMVAVPAPTAVANPVPLTVVTAVLLLDQVTTRPVSTVLLGSRSVAVNCAVSPTFTVAEAGLTATVDTGAGAAAVVAAVSEAEIGPNTAATLKVPRKAAT